jgi:hypothetical protein
MDIAGSARGQDGAEPASGADSVTAGAAVEFAGAAAAGAGAERAAGSVQPVAPLRGSASLVGSLLIYTLLRVGLVAVLTAVLMFFMPLIVALLFAIIVQLPLSWLLFAGPRRRLNDAMAQSSAKRRAERAKLQSALSGAEPPPPANP